MQKNNPLMTFWRICYPILLYFGCTEMLTLVLFLLAGFVLDVQFIFGMASILTGCLLLVFYKRDRVFSGYEREKERLYPLDLLYAIAAAVALSRVLNQALVLTPLPDLFTGYEEVTESLYGSGVLVTIFTSVIAAPFVEELLMRGLVYARMRELASVRAAMITSSLIFAVFHGNVVQGVYAFGIGLFLAFLYERYRDIRIPMAAHAAANAMSVLMTETALFDWMYADIFIYLAVTVLFGAAAVVCIRWIHFHTICRIPLQEQETPKVFDAEPEEEPQEL